MQNAGKLIKHIIDNLRYVSSYNILTDIRTIGWTTMVTTPEGIDIYYISLITDDIFVELAFIDSSTNINIQHYQRHNGNHLSLPNREKISIPEIYNLLNIYISAAVEQVIIPNISKMQIRKLHDVQFGAKNF